MIYGLNGFSYEAEKQLLVADASRLGIRPGQFPHNGDYRIDIRSHVTSKVETFKLSHTVGGGEETDGEISAWVYWPCNQALRVKEVWVFND